ncbi:MAG: chemotaxis protein CheW [Acidimicrobiales bacterium]
MQIRTDPGTSERHGDGLAVLLVDVDRVRCGIPAADVAELHPVVATVALPGAPAVIDGAVDVRGSVLAVLDLRGRLGLTRRRPLLSDHLVICRVGERSVALRVDRALELVSVHRRYIDEADHLAGGGHLSGVARLSDGLVLIQDLATFLSDEEAASLDGALDDLRPVQDSGR